MLESVEEMTKAKELVTEPGSAGTVVFAIASPQSGIYDGGRGYWYRIFGVGRPKKKIGAMFLIFRKFWIFPKCCKYAFEFDSF